VREVRRANMRGGAHDPIPPDEIVDKFRDNAQFGGWDSERAAKMIAAVDVVVGGGAVDLASAFR